VVKGDFWFVFDDLIECANNVQTEQGISPVMFVSNAVLFPGCLIPIRIFESRYQMMLKDVLSGNRTFILSFHPEDLTQPMTGSLGLIRSCVDQSDGTSILMLEGLKRVLLHQKISDRPYPSWKYKTYHNNDDYETIDEALVENLRNQILQLNKRVGSDFELYCSTENVDEITSTCDRLIDMTIHSLSFKKIFYDCLSAKRKIKQTLDIIGSINRGPGTI
jgi:Lon protease-like protein